MNTRFPLQNFCCSEERLKPRWIMTIKPVSPHRNKRSRLPPDAETLVAGDEGATLIAPNASTEDDDATEISSGSQPSDMARLHDVPTLIAAPDKSQEEHGDNEDATVINTTHASMAATQQARSAETSVASAPQPQSRPQSKPRIGTPPNWLWIAGALITIAVILGYWALKPMSDVIVVEPVKSGQTETAEHPPEAESTSDVTPELVISSELATDTETVPEPEAEAEPVVVSEAEVEDTPAPSTPLNPLNAELSATGALELLQQRADEGLLLPLNQTGNAQEVFEFLQRQYPDSPQLQRARQTLKDTYLAASKRAQGKGEWDDSQILLDAAFNVLSATAQ